MSSQNNSDKEKALIDTIKKQKEEIAKLNDLKDNNDQKGNEKQLIETIKKFKEENEQQQIEIQKLNDLKKTDDLFPGARKQKTFEGAFKNGYQNGEVEAFIKKEKEKEAKALVAQVEQ